MFLVQVKRRTLACTAALAVSWSSFVQAERAGPFNLHMQATSVGVHSAPSTRGPTQALIQRCAASDDQLTSTIKDVHNRQQNIGAQSAIYLNGKIVFSGSIGLADRDRGLPVTGSTRFPVASITKAFTGLAVLKAASLGKINLDAPIQSYVPEFPVKPELIITARRLAANRTGIRHWGAERNDLFSRRFDRLSQIIPLFADDPLLPKAGTAYQYSSYGYNLLGLALERATKTEFTRYVERHIIAPLRLSKTSFDSPRRALPTMAKLYSAYDLTNYAEVPAGSPLIPVPTRDYSHNMAGGNMSSTAEDLARFGSALLRPGLLPKREYDMLFVQPKFGGDPSPMSFGFFASDAGSEPRLNISGANPGVQASMFIYPERGLSVAVLTNSWGFGSRAAEFTGDLPKRLADLCAPRQERAPVA